MLFKDKPVTLPPTISALLADYDDGVIHACGLIVQLVEARFEGRPEVFIKNPETHLHPSQQRLLMSVIHAILQIGSDDQNDNPNDAVR
jgi:hypothetical protein